MSPFSLYVHIPYCLHKCPYCDFNTYALTSIPEREYVSALLSELDYWSSQSEWHGRTIRTIYFGGGTPSLFSANSIRKIISEMGGLFPIHESAEISLEANPGTVNSDSLTGYREAGVNRISLGAQSLERTLLKTLGRMHGAEEIEAAVAAARVAGIANINLDLMYGIPGQTLELLRQDLTGFLALSPEHISAYGLTIEKGTPFFTSVKRGALKLPQEEHTVEMMELVNSLLSERGFRHYEISNFARPHREARHNLAYWDGDDYLGLGAGAHSFRCSYEGERKVSARRWSNYALPKRYIQEACDHGHAESWNDTLDSSALMFEFFFLGLRKIQGVRISQFEEQFGISVQHAYPALMDVLIDQGLILRNADVLSLSAKGLLLCDSVLEHFTSPRPAAVSTSIVPLPSREETLLEFPKAANS